MVALKTLLFTVLVPGSVTVLIPYLLLPSGFNLTAIDWRSVHALGALPIVVGAAIYFRCAWDFTFAGHGTPAPIDPPKELVVTGLYRFVRNPMYVGVALIVVGEAILFALPALLLYGSVFAILAHLFAVFYEEPTLRKQFGESYEQYCRRVPRWIPRFR